MTDEPRRRPLSVLGLSNGDHRRSMSGVPGYLFDGLDREFAEVERVNYSVRGFGRAALAARTFRPTRAAWRGRFQAGRLAHRMQTASMRRQTAAAARHDVALQVHGWCYGQPRPLTLYVDQTRLMAHRGWPAWIPLPRRDRYWLLRAEREMYETAEHIFAMGLPTKESLAADYGIAPARVTAVGGGTNFSHPPEPRPLPEEQSILFVGRDFERKGGEVLLRAFRRVRRELPSARLDVAGPRRRIADGGVVVHGPLDRERVAKLFRNARVFCMPSLYEPYGLTFAEAMAYGVPCVGSTAQSIPEILADGQAGLIPPAGDERALADALVRLLRDDALAVALGETGRRYGARVHTWEQVAKRMRPGLYAAAAVS